MQKAIIALIGGAALVLSMGMAGSTNAADKYKVVDDNSIPESLTGKTGDAQRGKKLAVNRKKGNCLACHVMPIPEQLFHGQVGPTLKGVGARYNQGELRLRVANPKVLNADSIMPAFYKSEGLNRVIKEFQGKSVLSAQEVEDIVAYLMTLKEE